MGEFLSVPVKDKVSDDGENSVVKNKNFKYLFNNIVKIWVMFYARLEKKTGRFSY